MASIYGVELKGIKTWNGMEGMGLQANVYIDKKLVGQVTDDAYGGPVNYDFNTKELENRAENYLNNVWKKKPENAKWLHLYKDGKDFVDTFIDEICNLHDAEKFWKKAQRKLTKPPIKP